MEETTSKETGSSMGWMEMSAQRVEDVAVTDSSINLKGLRAIKLAGKIPLIDLFLEENPLYHPFNSSKIMTVSPISRASPCLIILEVTSSSPPKKEALGSKFERTTPYLLVLVEVQLLLMGWCCE